MRYDRCAYAAVDPASDLRVTYDTGIFCRMEDLTPVPDDRRFDPRHEMHRDGMSVMEVNRQGNVMKKKRRMMMMMKKMRSLRLFQT